MSNKKVKQDASIPAGEVIAEWFKNPKFVAAYDALEDEFAEIRRQMLAKRARRQRHALLVARVREAAHGFWNWLTRGSDRLAPS